jgi:hypothetical protein
MVRSKVRGVDEYIERLAARRCYFRLGDCRSADITCWIWCRFTLSIDGIELFVRIVRENEVVVE